MLDMEVLLRQRMGKTRYMLEAQMKTMKPGQKMLVIKGDEHIVITRNNEHNQIEHKGENMADIAKRLSKDGKQKTILFHFVKGGVKIFQVVNNNVTQAWDEAHNMTFDTIDEAEQFVTNLGWV